MCHRCKAQQRSDEPQYHGYTGGVLVLWRLKESPKLWTPDQGDPKAEIKATVTMTATNGACSCAVGQKLMEMRGLPRYDALEGTKQSDDLESILIARHEWCYQHDMGPAGRGTYIENTVGYLHGSAIMTITKCVPEKPVREWALAWLASICEQVEQEQLTPWEAWRRVFAICSPDLYEMYTQEMHNQRPQEELDL